MSANVKQEGNGQALSLIYNTIHTFIFIYLQVHFFSYRNLKQMKTTVTLTQTGRTPKHLKDNSTVLGTLNGDLRRNGDG